MSPFQNLSPREQRLIRYAGIGVAIYLLLFGGFEVWKSIDQRRADYRQLAQEARDLGQKTKPYQDRVLMVKKMMDDFHLDPARLKRETEVSEASAAIQNAAKSGGLQISSIRETSGHGSGMTLATLQLDSSGPVPATLTFLAGLNIIGYPLVIDSVQFTADNSRPGQVKMNLVILILDFSRQNGNHDNKEAAHA
jgi:hypothetical protein